MSRVPPADEANDLDFELAELRALMETKIAKMPKPPLMPLEEVASVYSGRPNACCCGCSGKHSYAKKWQKESGAIRGYKVKDSEVSDRAVRRIYGIVKKAKAQGQTQYDMDDMVTAVVGQRLYIVYRHRPELLTTRAT